MADSSIQTGNAHEIAELAVTINGWVRSVSERFDSIDRRFDRLDSVMANRFDHVDGELVGIKNDLAEIRLILRNGYRPQSGETQIEE